MCVRAPSDRIFAQLKSAIAMRAAVRAGGLAGSLALCRCALSHGSFGRSQISARALTCALPRLRAPHVTPALPQRLRSSELQHLGGQGQEGGEGNGWPHGQGASFVVCARRPLMHPLLLLPAPSRISSAPLLSRLGSSSWSPSHRRSRASSSRFMSG